MAATWPLRARSRSGFGCLARGLFVGFAQDRARPLHGGLVFSARGNLLQFVTIGDDLRRGEGGVLEFPVHRHRKDFRLLVALAQEIERAAARGLGHPVARDRTEHVEIRGARSPCQRGERLDRHHLARRRLGDLRE